MILYFAVFMPPFGLQVGSTVYQYIIWIMQSRKHFFTIKRPT